MSIDIVKAKIDSHFKAVARLHAHSITEGFLSTLGEPFLCSLYKGIAKAEGSGVFLAQNDEKILGFISYAHDVKICYKQVLRNNWQSLSLTMIPNAFKLTTYRKIFETLSYPNKQNTSSENDPHNKINEIRPELLAMAVSKDSRGLGVGKLLVHAVDEIMAQMDLHGYYVVTHGIDERSNGFYQGLGFVKVRKYKHHGKPMNEYYKEISTPNTRST